MKTLLTLTLAATMPLTASTLFDCPFECTTPGAANQAVCAPVAGEIELTVDQPYGIVNLTYSAYNGTILESLTLLLDNLTVFSQLVNLHSNGDSTTFFIPGAAPYNVVEASVVVRGIESPDRLTTFVAHNCCTASAVPEPATAELATGGLLLCLAALVRARVQRSHA